MVDRFFGSPEQAAVFGGVPGRRLELKGCLVAGPHSFSHVGLSKELATVNPELTLPMFCGKSKFAKEREETALSLPDYYVLYKLSLTCDTTSLSSYLTLYAYVCCV